VIVGGSTGTPAHGSSPRRRRHLEHVLRVYRQHYNMHRPHRALGLLPPNGRHPTPLNAPDRLQRRDLLGGLIHEYEAA
jgi:putative transposase